MTEKAHRTIHIKWVRSGIGFARWQKRAIHCLGLRRLHHVVERVDTPQIRGLVARIPRFVEIVAEPGRPTAWASVPEYTILPKEAQPAEALAAARAARLKRAKPARAAVTKTKEEPVEAAVEREAAPAKAKPAKAAKVAKGDAAKEKKEKKVKAAKEPGKKKTKAAAKPAKTSKSSKK